SVLFSFPFVRFCADSPTDSVWHLAVAGPHRVGSPNGSARCEANPLPSTWRCRFIRLTPASVPPPKAFMPQGLLLLFCRGSTGKSPSSPWVNGGTWPDGLPRIVAHRHQNHPMRVTGNSFATPSGDHLWRYGALGGSKSRAAWAALFCRGRGP